MKQNTTTTARVILDTDKKQATGLHFTLNHTGKMPKFPVRSVPIALVLQ